jgi:hypothetical protein
LLHFVLPGHGQHVDRPPAAGASLTPARSLLHGAFEFDQDAAQPAWPDLDQTADLVEGTDRHYRGMASASQTTPAPYNISAHKCWRSPLIEGTISSVQQTKPSTKKEIAYG